jgi:hypothetical protein
MPLANRLAGAHVASGIRHMLNSPAPLLCPTTTPGLPLGPLAGCAQRTVVLTATLLGGYTDELLTSCSVWNQESSCGKGLNMVNRVCGLHRNPGLLEKITVRLSQPIALAQTDPLQSVYVQHAERAEICTYSASKLPIHRGPLATRTSVVSKAIFSFLTPSRRGF